jgi:hypothetical protein
MIRPSPGHVEPVQCSVSRLLLKRSDLLTGSPNRAFREPSSPRRCGCVIGAYRAAGFPCRANGLFSPAEAGLQPASLLAPPRRGFSWWSWAPAQPSPKPPSGGLLEQRIHPPLPRKCIRSRPRADASRQVCLPLTNFAHDFDDFVCGHSCVHALDVKG